MCFKRCIGTNEEEKSNLIGVGGGGSEEQKYPNDNDTKLRIQQEKLINSNEMQLHQVRNDHTKLIKESSMDAMSQKLHNSKVTDGMIENVGQMIILWLFVIAQCAFGFLKYGPFYAHPKEQCAILTPNFSKQCNIYWLFPVQCAIYGALFCLFWVCTIKKSTYQRFEEEEEDDGDDDEEENDENELSDIKTAICERMTHCDQLLFPLFVLAFLIFSEVLFAIFSPNIDRFWYLWQIGTDFFGYSLWFIYSTVAGKLASMFCQCANIKLNKNALLCHILFIFVAFVAVFWLIIAMFAQDFAFDLNVLSKFAFIQIIAESILIIEWIHVVIESGIQHSHLEDKEDKMFTQRGQLLGNYWLILAFILEILGHFIFGFSKFFHSKCSNFDFRLWFEYSGKDCDSSMWIGQLITYIVAFLCLFIGFFRMQNGKHLILLEWNRLYFPLCIWIMLLFIEFLFIFTINPHYIVQTLIDFTGYILFFVQALYIVQFRKYYKRLSGEGKCFALLSPRVEHQEHDKLFRKVACGPFETPNPKLLAIYLIIACYALIFFITLIANLVMDVNDVRKAAESMSHNYGKPMAVIESIAFIQIVFENTLLVEYIHVLIGPIH